MRYFVDSNIFLRFFAKEENSRVLKECALFIEALKKGKIKATTSHLVIAEVVWTLLTAYKTSKENVVKVVLSIESLSGIKIIDRFITAEAHKMFKDYNVKYIDALIASSPNIRSKKWAVVSYDKDFDKLGVIRKEPQDII
jgi:predicted nucleic-acid-binding protein